MTQYFKKFPVINYSNTSAVNLMARVNMTKLALNNKQAYYSYQIPDGMRSDNLSYNYYDNPDYVWLINLANQITDPYYEYPLADSDVYTLITQKYGSVANAQQIIDHFATNWATDSSNISVDAYNRLTAAQKKYWAPVVDNNNTIYEYVRKQEDWIVTTNEVQQLSLSYSAELITEDGYVLDTEDSYDLTCPEGANKVPFVVGELVQQNGYTIGTVAYASETVLNIQHISGQVVSPQTVTMVSTGSTGNVVSTSSNTAGIYVGMPFTSSTTGSVPVGTTVVAVNTTPGSNSFTLSAAPTSTISSGSVVLGNTTFSASVTGAVIGPIVGLSSGAIGTITDIYTASQNIPAAEAQYWSPVTAYDMIYNNNASIRNITILNNSYAQQATKELKKLMSV
jgi:hypothetical protein